MSAPTGATRCHWTPPTLFVLPARRKRVDEMITPCGVCRAARMRRTQTPKWAERYFMKGENSNMKKNLMMRIASVVLMLTLITTCAISGTLAKYVTTVSGDDDARTAVWDIVHDGGFTTDGTSVTFQNTYDATVASNADTDAVGEVDANDDVVAPGTTGTNTYSITGTPETDYVVTFGLEDNEGGIKTTDVTLNAGTYTFDAPYQDMTVTVDKNYLPLKWEVTISTTNGTIQPVAEDGEAGFTAGTAEKFNSLAEIKTALAAVEVAFEANETCDVDVKIEWTWAFETTTDGYTAEDKMDTVLGYYAAKNVKSDFELPFTTSEGVTDAVVEVKYDFSMTATQVD